MQKITLVLFFLVFFNSFNTLLAQEKTQITGTDLKIVLSENLVLDENSSTLTNQDFAMLFMEMAGVDFKGQIENFQQIEAKYAEKGISVKKNQRGKISNYDAFLISLDTRPATYQVFFGNDDFCAFAQVMAHDSTSLIDESKVNAILNTVEYVGSTISPLEEHANFTIDDKTNQWEFISYVANTFGFEHKEREDAIMLMQLPPETLFFASKEFLANEFVTKLKSKMPNIEIVEDGQWSTKNIEGHRILLDLAEDGNGNLGMIYIYVFGSDKSAFVFQGMGKQNDTKTKVLFEEFLQDLALKQ